MKKITAFIEDNKKDLYLDVCINKPDRSIMSLRNAAIYWKYKNVITGDNDHIMKGTIKIPFEEGYWTFNMMKEKLEKHTIKLEANRHNNACKIYSETQDLNLKKFGELLGFPEDKTVSSGTWGTSLNVVDVNRGLRYININCDLVDTSQNSNTNGQRSYTLATLSIPSDQLLNSTVTYFRNIDSRVAITNGCFNRLSFDVDTNINIKVDMSLLLELYIY